VFTIGVFKDVVWADRGLAALIADGFDPASLSVFARSSPEVEQLVRTHLESAPEVTELPELGRVIGCGSILATFNADEALRTSGLAVACARAGFQRHDGYIFQALVERGGVLVAVDSVARAADALARLHAYGGGNAAIGVHQKDPLVKGS
jgi:hypothetical protein